MMHSIIIYLPHLLAFCGFGILLGGIAAVQQVRICLATNFSLLPTQWYILL